MSQAEKRRRTADSSPARETALEFVAWVLGDRTGVSESRPDAVSYRNAVAQSPSGTVDNRKGARSRRAGPVEKLVWKTLLQRAHEMGRKRYPGLGQERREQPKRIELQDAAIHDSQTQTGCAAGASGQTPPSDRFGITEKDKETTQSRKRAFREIEITRRRSYVFLWNVRWT